MKRLSSIFFFQAEDGIRDRNVTGVQTCALPILDTVLRGQVLFGTDWPMLRYERALAEIGRASCRERVEISGVAVSLKKKKESRKIMSYRRPQIRNCERTINMRDKKR